MALETFAASFSSPTATCARRASIERTRNQKPLQALPSNLCRAGRSAPSSKHGRGSGRLLRQACRAAPKDRSSAGDLGEFDLAEYVEAKVDSVKRVEQYGHVIFLRLVDDQCNSLMPVYIGDFEMSALVNEINKQPTMRPMTHDLMRDSLTLLGFRVTKVCVTELRNRTYHARIHYAAAPGAGPGAVGGEINIDARPSDAINLSIRFGAPIYVARKVAAQMARPAMEFQVKETVTEIERSCRSDLAHFPDPTVQLQLALQLAIMGERYGEAARLRNQIDNLLASDRALSLVVAIETALEDKRFEEAQRLRDELRQLRTVRLMPEKQDA
jgi:bifunctional DNase/RNase